MHKDMRNRLALHCESRIPWADLSDLAKNSISHGLTADQMERMANLMLQTAAEMRRARLGGEMARA